MDISTTTQRSRRVIVSVSFPLFPAIMHLLNVAWNCRGGVVVTLNITAWVDWGFGRVTLE